MRASRLLCIALAHTGLCPQQQQQLREEVSGWQPGLGLSVRSSCNRVHPTKGAVGRDNREVVPNGPFSKPFEYHESHLGHKCFWLCWAPLLPPRESRVFAGCACSSLCSTTREAGLFSGKCSVTLTVTLEKDFMAAHGQLQHPQQRQFHCSLCAIAEPVWHPCLLACLKEAGI